MIKVSIFYPHKGGGQFDMHYYLETHMPMFIGVCCPKWVTFHPALTLSGFQVKTPFWKGSSNCPSPKI